MTEGEKEARERRCWKQTGIFGDSSCPSLEKYVHCRNCPQYSRAGRAFFDRDLPEGFLSEWTKIVSEPKEVPIKDTLSVMIFRLRTEWLAIKTILLEETVETRKTHSIPLRTNDIFLGIVNVNGELMLCVSVARMLGVEKEIEKKSKRGTFERMIIVNRNGERFIFSVDEIAGIRRIPLEILGKAPVTLSKSPSALTGSVFSFEGKAVGLIDEEQFFQSMKRSIAP